MPETSVSHLFTCRVTPERYGWHLDPPVSVTYTRPGTDVTFKLSLLASQVLVTVTNAVETALLDLKNGVRDLASSFVDSLGFVNAAALQVEVVSCVDPAGQFHVFSTGFDGLRDIDTADVELMLKLVTASWNSWELQSALSDIRQAILEPNATATLCYRAVESIRQKYRVGNDDSANRSASWSALRDATGVSRSELDWLGHLATPRRHGELRDLSEGDRRRALRMARQVVENHVRHGE